MAADAQAETPLAETKTPSDAVELLVQDHQDVKAMFDEFQSIKDSGNDKRKLELAESICLALTVHTQAEEEIFYPQFRKATQDADMVDEAIVEHQAAKDLIAQIEEMEPGDDLFDAKVHVLSEEIEHHVKEEEEEMFPKARESKKLDLVALGRQIADRKQQLFEALAAGD